MKFHTILFVALLGTLIGCEEDRPKEALRNQGFTDIRTTGYSPLSCGEGDVTSTGFTAMNKEGRPVSGVVCCGILKGCTVRW